MTLTGTYTCDLLAEVVDHWVEFLGLELGTELGDYGQLFQQLLSPVSPLRQNRGGANVVALRWEDLCGQGLATGGAAIAWPEVEAQLTEVVAALLAHEHATPCLLLVGPSTPDQPALSRATIELRERLAGTPNLFFASGDEAVARYAVVDVHDAASDRFGHVPYTPEAFAALGTTLARWYASLVRAPLKAFAVDGDQTLWSGVVGEDGADGVRIEAAHQKLQSRLVEQSRQGRLLCLLSKNEDADVRALFARRTTMPLQWSHFSASRIDWNAKPGNLQSLAGELELGSDSFAFLDDNPVECADMRASCPAVLTVRVPTDAAALAAFVDHLWLFDQPRVTEEDRQRARQYRDNAARAELRGAVATLGEFLGRLELRVEFAEPAPADVPRLAQLSQRTNQFNASLLRCDETEVRRGLADAACWHRLVRVRDRFGDYGIVGQVRATVRDACLSADLFMLSCRALGRGVEHRMLAALGAQALELGLDQVELQYRSGERNTPLRRFLGAVSTSADPIAEPGLRLSARWAAALVFDAAVAPPAADREAPEPEPTAPLRAAWGADRGALYEHIAHHLVTGAAIVRAMARRVRARPDLATGFVAPAAGLARELAHIWQEVLRIDKVGAQDRFTDLGGKSIHLVQVHRVMLERLHIDVDITTLFQHATVTSLAAHLAAPAGAPAVNGANSMAQARARNMRDARTRAAARHGVSS